MTPKEGVYFYKRVGKKALFALSELGGLLSLFQVVSQSSTTGYFPLRLPAQRRVRYQWHAYTEEISCIF